MSKVFIADPIRDAPQIRDIFWGYLQWANQEITASYQVSFDIQSILETNMLELHPFLPPDGRLLLCFPQEQPAGVACLKRLTSTEQRALHDCRPPPLSFFRIL